jgi:mediator of RNA polymerase II transcription subunit 5
MHAHCRNKETQSLKNLANAITRKPSAINCISLFIRPSSFMAPLCHLLDEWRWDEIHGGCMQIIAREC